MTSLTDKFLAAIPVKAEGNKEVLGLLKKNLSEAGPKDGFELQLN